MKACAACGQHARASSRRNIVTALESTGRCSRKSLLCLRSVPMEDEPDEALGSVVDRRGRLRVRSVQTARSLLNREFRWSIHENEGSTNMTRNALLSAIMSASVALGAHAAVAEDTAAEISKNADAALASLYATVAGAKALGAQAQAVLVFPKITKAGLGIGGQRGEGALIKKGKTVAYYRTTGASYGLQAGAQTFSYAMFFMNDKALKELDKANGFEVGVGPSVVVMDEGMAKNSTTTTMKDDIYAFIFGQKGLMAGLGLQGNKITKIEPK
jgi:lipid-binding SYLF domain-containing protein